MMPRAGIATMAATSSVATQIGGEGGTGAARRRVRLQCSLGLGDEQTEWNLNALWSEGQISALVVLIICRQPGPRSRKMPKRSGFPISFWEFTKKGAVVTAVTILLAAPYLWLRYFVLTG